MPRGKPLHQNKQGFRFFTFLLTTWGTLPILDPFFPIGFYFNLDLMETLKRICRWIDTLNEWVGQGIAFITVGLVAVVFADVVMRYAFRKSSVVVQELEWHLFGFIFLLGAGYTLLHDGHVRVDVVYQRLKPIVRAWINLIGVIGFLIPGCLMVIITSWKFAYNSWLILEGSPDPGGIPLRFIIKGAITVGFLLLLVQGIALGLRSLAAVLGEQEEKG